MGFGKIGQAELADDRPLPGQLGVEHRVPHQRPVAGGQHLIESRSRFVGGKRGGLVLWFTPPGGVAQRCERRFARFGPEVARQQRRPPFCGRDELPHLVEADRI